MRRSAQVILTSAVVTAISLWAATAVLVLFMPAGRAWVWTALASAAALVVAAGAVAFGRKP